MDVKNYIPRSGRMIREDNTVVNKADGINADGSQNVKVTGRKFQDEELLSRAVRSTVAAEFATVPEGATGLVLELTIYGVTGAFSSGEGANIRMTDANSNLSSAYGSYQIDTDKTNGIGDHIIQLDKGLSIGDATVVSATGSVKLASLVPMSRIRYALRIDGTFAGGEGFDCQLDVRWLF